MDLITSIENFEDGNPARTQINSPRTLEACLRSGIDPSELYSIPDAKLKQKGMTEEMNQYKIQHFHEKRKEKIELVRKEREKILAYVKRLQAMKESDDGVRVELLEVDGTANMLLREEARMNSLRKRQEKELAQTVEKEKTAAELQLKIQRAEAEERKKQKIHAQKVAQQKKEEEKKRKELERLEKEKLVEEERVKREIAKKDAEVADKIRRNRLKVERQLAAEARARDMERTKKMEEYREKTAALLKIQEDKQEENKKRMKEREDRIAQQLVEKKEHLAREVAAAREKADLRIQEATKKFQAIHEKKRQDFDEKQAKAAALAKENAILERERLKKQADARERKVNTRFRRLVEAYNNRSEKRNNVIKRREEKSFGFMTINEERSRKMAMSKFQRKMKLNEKQDNVERVARVNEFKRLQTLERINKSDAKYEEIQNKKKEMLRKHSESAKYSMMRKHEISEVMEKMKQSNNYSLLDNLFSTNGVDDEEKEDKKFNSTM